MYEIKKYHTSGSLTGMITKELLPFSLPVGFTVERSYVSSGYMVVSRKKV